VDIEQLKLIVTALEGAGEDAKQLVIWYLVLDFLKHLLGVTLGAVALFCLFSVLPKACLWASKNLDEFQ
jgi:hypothetical protein